MSTRANIIVTDGQNKQYFYRHSDGYPEGTLPTLKKYLNLIKDGKIRDNTSQSCGWLVIIGAEEYKSMQMVRKERSYEELTEAQKKEWSGKISSMPVNWKVGSYEPCDGITGWIEYLYIVNINRLSIEVRGVSDSDFAYMDEGTNVIETIYI